jgi:addiction module RelE/StbE family toxin
MRVVWTDDALDDLESIRSYIEEDSPAAAMRVLRRLRDALQRLADNPRMGRTGRVLETRELVFSNLPYIGVYRILEDADRIEILDIIHTSQDYPPATE